MNGTKNNAKRNRYYWIDCKCIQCGRNFKASREDAGFCNDNGGKCKSAYHREKKKVESKLKAINKMLSEISEFPKRYGFILGEDAIQLEKISHLISGMLRGNTHQEAFPIMYIDKSAQGEKTG